MKQDIFQSVNEILNHTVRDGEISLEHSFRFFPEILSGPLPLFTSILSNINLVSAILIPQDSQLGLAMSLICGKSDICLGAAKFAWKNLLKRNAFRIDVWTKEVSKYTFSGIFFTFSFSPQQAPKTFRISWNILGTFFYEAIVFVINQIF